MSLRPYQNNALSRSLEALKRGCNRQLLVMATGLGKAVLFAALREHHGFRKRVMVLVHREELADQASDKLMRWNPGLMLGVEMANRRARPMDTFIVASVPTIGRQGSKRIEQFDPRDFDAVVSDECHHSISPQWRRVLDHFGLMAPGSTILSLGLTATPNRSDGAGLRDCFDEIVFDMGIRDGIESGFLADLRGIRVNTKTSLDAVKPRAGDFAEDELADTVNTPQRNAIIVKEWAKHAWDKKTVCFTVNIQHALDLAEAFKSHVVAAEAIWGDDPDRREKLRRHRAGEITVLTNCAVLTEGYDDPSIECIVMAKPTKSSLLYTQMVGRGTRISEGKEACLLIDVVDNTQKHNLVTMPSLLGLPKDLDLKGKSVTKAKQEFERVAKEFPTANLQDVRNLDALKSMAENISLFTVSYPPEVGQLTELAWRKSQEGYMLSVGRDLVTITKDLRDEYQVRGWVGATKVELSSQNLPGAFNQADRALVSLVADKRLLVRDARWRVAQPTDNQIQLCRKLNLAIPAGATRGAVSAAIDARLRARREVAV